MKYKEQAKRTSGRFFCYFRNGSSTLMPIGKTTIANISRQIALFLGLENASLYTGHALRVTSATVMADSGADILSLKRHGRWTSDSIAE
jgi:hypothetical protein